MMKANRERGGILWKMLVLITFLLLVGVVYLLRHPLLSAMGSLLVVDEKLKPADAIIVLGDDNYRGDRARHAAKLYQDRWAPRVVASGRYIRPYASLADLIRRDLVENGVAQDHVVAAPSNVRNTREEAFEMRRIIREQRWRRVIVVTSTYHSRRARYIFRRALDPDTELEVSAADDADFPLEQWWESRGAIKLFFRELLAWPVAIWEMSGEQPSSFPAPLVPLPVRP